MTIVYCVVTIIGIVLATQWVTKKERRRRSENLSFIYQIHSRINELIFQQGVLAAEAKHLTEEADKYRNATEYDKLNKEIIELIQNRDRHEDFVIS